MNEQELLNWLIVQNQWWKSGELRLEKDLIERDVYKKIIEDINTPEVLALVGLRRIGKTTLLKQLIRHLLTENKVQPKNVLYLSFDAMKREETIIKRVLNLYFQQILQKATDEIGIVYVFFDEVQKVKEWGEEIKSFYDLGVPIKFFVSGSSSMNILKGSGESLIGRIKVYKIYPFSFREYLKYHGTEINEIGLNKIKYPVQAEKIIILFNNYLKFGGFPELYKLTEAQLKNNLKVIIDLTFYRDIVNIFEVKRTDILEGLFYSFVRESGNVINYSNLANSLNTKFETIKTYVEYLISSFLISKSMFFSESKIKTFEKNPKIYAADHAFSHLSEIEEGLKVETAVFNHCIRSSDIFYWKDERKHETDMILVNKGAVPVEVKYKSQIDKKDLRGLLKFMEKFKVMEGIVVTKDLFETKRIEGERIRFIPAWLFLLTTPE